MHKKEKHREVGKGMMDGWMVDDGNDDGYEERQPRPYRSST